MYESRKSIWMSVFTLLFGLAAGMAYAHDGSTHGMNLDTRNQPTPEEVLANVDIDLSVTVDTEISEPAFEPVVEPDCDSDTALTITAGMDPALTASSFSWTCGSCSISACKNRPVGTPCGIGKWCVVSTICLADQPITDRCVCGTDHF